MAGTKFPGPYVNDTKIDESLMKYVPFDNTEIGSRKSGMPKGIGAEKMSIDHVGDSTPGPVSSKFPK